MLVSSSGYRTVFFHRKKYIQEADTPVLTAKCEILYICNMIRQCEVKINLVMHFKVTIDSEFTHPSLIPNYKHIYPYDRDCTLAL